MIQSKITKIDRWRYKMVSKYCLRNVLDIGCGQSGLRDYVSKEKYIGCDLYGGDVQCSAYSLPFASGSFDTVVLCEILEHLGMHMLAIEEAARVASSRIVVTVPNDYSLVRFARLLLGKEVEIEDEHIVSYNSWNLSRMFENFGYKAIKSFCYPLRLQLCPEVPIKCRFGYWLFMIFDKMDRK